LGKWGKEGGDWMRSVLVQEEEPIKEAVGEELGLLGE
jgi:hypothetical protein